MLYWEPYDNQDLIFGVKFGDDPKDTLHIELLMHAEVS